MPNVNHMLLQGHFGRAPETKFMPNGKAVCNFSVAYSYKKDAPTTWFNCSAFEKNAELIQQYFVKGSAPLLQGQMSSREYTNKDGQKVTAWEFKVDRILDFGPRKEGAEAQQKPAQRQAQPAMAEDDDSLPF